MQTPQGFHTSGEACDVKEIFKEYFSAKEGGLHWQDRYAATEDLWKRDSCDSNMIKVNCNAHTCTRLHSVEYVALHLFERHFPLIQELLTCSITFRTNGLGCSHCGWSSESVPSHSGSGTQVRRGGPHCWCLFWSPYTDGTVTGPDLCCGNKCGSAPLGGEGAGLGAVCLLGYISLNTNVQIWRNRNSCISSGHFCKVKAKLLTNASTSWSISDFVADSRTFRTWSRLHEPVGAIFGGGPDLLGADVVAAGMLFSWFPFACWSPSWAWPVKVNMICD